jgi:hypothetical protein
MAVQPVEAYPIAIPCNSYNKGMVEKCGTNTHAAQTHHISLTAIPLSNKGVLNTLPSPNFSCNPWLHQNTARLASVVKEVFDALLIADKRLIFVAGPRE